MGDETNRQEPNGAPTRAQPSGGSRGERRDSGTSELSPEGGSEQCGACPDDTPASFEKRAAAWMGIVYVLMLLFILNFTLFTGGRQLPGTFPLFLVPVSVTLAVVVVHRMRNKTIAGGTAGGVAVLAGCAVGAAVGLSLGVPALLAALGG